MITDLETEDYVSFCGLNVSSGSDASLPRTAVSSMDATALVVDVRPTIEYGITKLDGSLNLPIQRLLKDPQEAWNRSKRLSLRRCWLFARRAMTRSSQSRRYCSNRRSSSPK